MAKRPQPKKQCALCGEYQSEGRPMLELGPVNICFQCMEHLNYRMFTSDFGSIACERVSRLIQNTHPEVMASPARAASRAPKFGTERGINCDIK